MKIALWVVLALLWSSAMFVSGWIWGVGVVTREIAEAIVTGHLSVEQKVEAIAEQIESGIYTSINGVVTHRGRRWTDPKR